MSTKSDGGLFAALARRHRERFFIFFNCKGAYNPVTGRYDKFCWPIPFKSHGDAEIAMKILPIFANKDPIPGRGRIISASIEKRMVSR